MTRTLVAVVLILIIAGCGPVYNSVGVVPNKQFSQRLDMVDGVPVVVSSQVNSVALSAGNSAENGGRVDLNVVVANNSDEILQFDADAISVSARLPSGEVISLHAYSYQELVEEEKKRQKWQNIAAGLKAAGDGMSAANAGRSSSQTAFQGTTSYGTTFSGTATTQTYDYGAAQHARQDTNSQNRKMLADLRNNQRAALGGLQQSIIKSHTIYPGYWHSGLKKIDMPKLAKGERATIFVKLSLGDEQHTFEIMTERAP